MTSRRSSLDPQGPSRSVDNVVAADPAKTARANLAALDRALSPESTPSTFEEDLGEVRRIVHRMLGQRDRGTAPAAGRPRPGGLANLADPVLFEILYDAVATAIADIFQFKLHYNVPALRSAFHAWIAGHSGARSGGSRGMRFADIVSVLIATLVPHRILSFSVMTRDASSDPREADVFVKYPNELTALLLGGAIYAAKIRQMTGRESCQALTNAAVERAASALRNEPAAAAAFRQLLSLRER
jgi:hypothetical protein